MDEHKVTRPSAPSGAAVIVAAGRSERMAGGDKLWSAITGPDGCVRPLLAYSLAAFQQCDPISDIVLVVAAGKVELAGELVAGAHFDKVRAVVPGGPRRQDSVRAGLEAAAACEYVVVHDGARPLVTPNLIAGALDAAQATGAACCGISVPDTVKVITDGVVFRTLDRSNLMLAQTPQAFRYDLLLDAHSRSAGDATDDASMVEALGITVHIAPGSSSNIKVTTVEDLAIAQALMSAR